MHLTRLLAPLIWRNKRRRYAIFAAAELSSRYDLLAAANLATDPRVAALAIRHASDELRHARLFHGRAVEPGVLAEEYRQQEGGPEQGDIVAAGLHGFEAWRFVERRAVELGPTPPLRADFEHLYERLGQERFFAFVHLGETRACRQLSVWSAWFGRGKDQRVLSSVLPDESRHAEYTADLAGSLRQAALWEATRSWMRAGRVISQAVYNTLAVGIYLALAPLAMVVPR